jgi:hypothetical protein
MFCGIIFLTLAGLTLPVHAVGDSIRFTQAGSGAISAILDGLVEPCAGSVIFPMGVPSVGVNGNEFDITSFFVILDPAGCPSPPQPYEVTASLGTLVDGHYTVVWTIGPLIVRGAFDVSAGVLQFTANSVPTLTPFALTVLFAMIALAGVALRRQRRR